MPSWTHLLIGFTVLGLGILGLSKTGEAKGQISGGGSRLNAKAVEVEGRRYFVIQRDATIFEVFSPDDPNAWVIFDASIPGKSVDIVAKGSNIEQLRQDIVKFPKEIAQMFKAAEGAAGR